VGWREVGRGNEVRELSFGRGILYWRGSEEERELLGRSFFTKRGGRLVAGFGRGFFRMADDRHGLRSAALVVARPHPSLKTGA